jgi:hypothetical protein
MTPWGGDTIDLSVVSPVGLFVKMLSWKENRRVIFSLFPKKVFIKQHSQQY